MELSRAPLEIRPVRADDQPAWDAIAHASDDAWLTHTWRWNELIEAKVMGGADRSLVVVRGGRVVGIAPLHLHERGRGPLRHRVMYSNFWAGGGLALANDVLADDRRAAFAATFRAMAQQARREGVDKLMVFLSPLTRRSLRSDPEARRGIDQRGLSDHSSTALVLRIAGRSKQELWDALEGRARTKVRKAERAGVTVERASECEGFDIVYPLHLETCRRTGAVPYPPEYLSSTLASGDFHVFAARHEGRVIGSLTLALFGGRALFDVSASLDEALRLGANNLLLWRALEWLVDAGAEAFELGQVPGPGLADSAKLSSIAYHHRSFSPDEIPAFGGELIYRPAREVLFRLARGLAARAAPKVRPWIAPSVFLGGADLMGVDFTALD